LHFSKEIPADLAIIPECIDIALEQIKQLPLDASQVHDIRLSLQEALVNAVKHGSRSDRALPVRLDIETKENSLVLTVSDRGEGFDFHNVLDPTEAKNLQKLSGRGIFLIRNLMNKVEFFDGGRKITMIKFLQKGGKK
jgi:serine/threonine-protein kinase RsbW